MESSKAVYKSAGISYIESAIPFSERYAKSSGSTLPHFAKRSSSTVSAPSASMSDFFSSKRDVTVLLFSATPASSRFSARDVFGAFISERIADAFCAHEKLSFKAESFSLSPSRLSKCMTPSLRNFSSASFFSFSRMTTETFFIATIISLQPPVSASISYCVRLRRLFHRRGTPISF